MNTTPRMSWPAPIPFYEFDPPAFPTGALPGPIRDWVQAEAIQTQTPTDLSAMLALSVVATAVAKKAVVAVRPGWFEPLNIYALVALDPASRKSAVVRDAIAPVLEHEADQAKLLAPMILMEVNRLKIATMRLEKAQKAAAAAEGQEAERLEREACALACDLEVIKVPVAPRLVADDATPEKLCNLMAAHDGRIAILSAEGDVFEVMGGRYSKGGTPNLGVYLKGHAGDMIRVDRVGRPPDCIQQPAVTIGVSVQPNVLLGLMDRPGFRGRGLLARFLYSLPSTLLGSRQVDPPPMPASVRGRYSQIVRSLLDKGEEDDRNDDDGVSARPIRLTPSAVARIQAFQTEIEPRLGLHGDLGLMSDWGGKLAGAIIRIAGLLYVIDAAARGLSWDVPLQEGTIERAIRIGRYLIPHAKAAYMEMGADPVVEQAKLILRWCERNDKQPFSLRDAFEDLKGRFKRVDAMAAPMALLMQHHYIRQAEPEERSGPGRPPSPQFEVNPHWSSQYSHNPQNSSDRLNSANSANSANGILPEIEEDDDLEEGVI